MIDDEWLRRLGKAVLYFSFVETAVVSIINSLALTHPSYMEQSMYVKKTAGEVAKDLKEHIRELPEGTGRSELDQLATRFKAAVVRRNELIHAIPASFGEQTHLVRITQGTCVVWSMTLLAEVADEFEKLADDLALAHFQHCTPPTFV